MVTNKKIRGKKSIRKVHKGRFSVFILQRI